MMKTPAPQPRCGYPVVRAACCPGSPLQGGTGTHNPLLQHVAVRRLGPAASPSMESGSSPTLCLRSGTGMCPGRVQPGYSSWEEVAQAALIATPQNFSPTPPTLLLQASVCHILPRNNCVAGHCKYLYCYHLNFQPCLCH